MVLALCRDAVGVFCSSSRLGNSLSRTHGNLSFAHKNKTLVSSPRQSDIYLLIRSWFGLGFFVTYWPSTQASIKKQVHPGRRYRGITLTCGRVEFGAIATPTVSRWMSNNYISRCHRRLGLVGVSCSWSSSCCSRQWEPAPDRGLGPSGPRLSSLAEWGRSAAIVRGTWGQYVAVCSVSNSPLTHNQHQPFRNPFENKVWDIYFSKEVCSFVIIVDYVSASICIRIVVLRLYNTLLNGIATFVGYLMSKPLV